MLAQEIFKASHPTLLLPIAAVFLLAGLVKGVVGLGLPTLSMALLALMMTPTQAAVLLIVPSLITNVWQLKPWSSLGPLLRRLGGMQIGICLGTWVGALILGAPAGAWATALLGFVLMLYAVWSLLGSQLSITLAAQKWLGPVTGALTGVVTAATGVFVVPAVPYLQAVGLQHDELIQAMGISFTVSTLTLAVGLAANAAYSASEASLSVLMVLPALAGMALGQRLRQVLSPSSFRLFFLFSLGVLGAYMVMRE